MEGDRFYSEDNLVKRDTNCQDDSAMLLCRPGKQSALMRSAGPT